MTSRPISSDDAAKFQNGIFMMLYLRESSKMN